MSVYKYVVIGALFYSFLSCSNSDKITDRSSQLDSLKKNNNWISYYDNGNIKEVGNIVKNQYEGLYREYYENGQIRFIHYYKNGLLNGVAREFYEDGNPKFNMFYLSNKPFGVQYIYDKDDSTKVQTKLIFSQYDGKEILVSKQEFNLSGDIVTDKSRVKIELLKDTISYGEKIVIGFTLSNPEFDKYRIHVGNFSRSLELIDSSGYITKDGVGHKGYLELQPVKLGKNVVRGYMEDYKIDKVNKDGSYSTIGKLNNWFDIEFFVDGK